MAARLTVLIAKLAASAANAAPGPAAATMAPAKPRAAMAATDLDMASIEFASRTFPAGASSATRPLAAGVNTALATPAPAWRAARSQTVA